MPVVSDASTFPISAKLASPISAEFWSVASSSAAVSLMINFTQLGQIDRMHENRNAVMCDGQELKRPRFF